VGLLRSDFSEGLARVVNVRSPEKLFGFVDRAGSQLIGMWPHWVQDFSEEPAPNGKNLVGRKTAN
jgi:hypothetical protein